MHVSAIPANLYISSLDGGIMICFIRTFESFPHKFTKTLLVTLGNQHNLECSVTGICKWREMKVWSDGLSVHYFGHDIFPRMIRSIDNELTIARFVFQYDGMKYAQCIRDRFTGFQIFMFRLFLYLTHKIGKDSKAKTLEKEARILQIIQHSHIKFL